MNPGGQATSGSQTRRVEPRRASCDVIVVGGGVAGLTAGALLAQAGRAVVVVEAEGRPGGHARAVQDGGYWFDPAVHLIMGCGEGGIVDAVLRRLGVRERCEFVASDPFYSARFPGLELVVPGGREPYLEAHGRLFPAEAAGFRRLVEKCDQVYREFLAFPAEPRLRDLMLSPRRFPALFRYRNATVRDVRDRELGNPRARAVYSAPWPYLGVPPGRAAFLDWAVMIASYVGGGAWYCRGSFQRLADALAEALGNHGGELLLGTRVERVRREHGRVSGVELAGGVELAAPLVLSSADPRETFATLADPSRRERKYMKRLAALEPAISTVGVSLATDLDPRDLGACQENLVNSSWDAEQQWQEISRGHVPAAAVTIPSVTDPTVAPAGEATVSLMAFLPRTAAPSAPERKELARQLLAYGEQVLPGLHGHVTHVPEPQPGAEDEFPLHRIDAIYGWQDSPQQAGPNRLAQQTPINGLRLVGHWTRPSHGIFTVILSAIHAVSAITGETLP